MRNTPRSRMQAEPILRRPLVATSWRCIAGGWRRRASRGSTLRRRSRSITLCSTDPTTCARAGSDASLRLAMRFASRPELLNDDTPNQKVEAEEQAGRTWPHRERCPERGPQGKAGYEVRLLLLRGSLL